MWRMYHDPFSPIKEREEVRMMSPHLNMVLVARLDLDCSISKERKFTWVADVHLKRRLQKDDECERRCLESVPIRVDGGGARLVAVTVDCHLVECFFFFRC